MSTRIIFNGQEYASPDAMPPDVRQAYDQALKQLASKAMAKVDANPDRGRPLPPRRVQ